ncbi:MAG: hypothetical protein AAB455_03350 [Patescibacteria group bacterium]
MEQEQSIATEKNKLSFANKVILVILAIVFIFVFYLTLDANKYRALVQVVEGEGQIGVNPTASALDFGDLSRGSSAVRRVALTNGTRWPIYVLAFKTGNIRSLIDIDENYFRLEPHSSTKIEFLTYIPASAKIGDKYQGRVYLFKVPLLF